MLLTYNLCQLLILCNSIAYAASLAAVVLIYAAHEMAYDPVIVGGGGHNTSVSLEVLFNNCWLEV